MLIAVITWSSLTLVLLALSGAVFGVLEMRKEDALRAARGKSIAIVSAIVFILFTALFIVGLYRLRATPVEQSTQVPQTQTGNTGTLPGNTPDARDPKTSGGTVITPVQGAEIFSVSPPEGVRGRIVTIMGRGLGDAPGTVQFRDTQGTITQAKLVQSSECTPTPWSATAILVTVPDLPSAEYTVGVTLADGTVVQPVPFRITNLGVRTSICRIDPEHGIPETTTVTIFGSDLGDTPGKVLFGTIPATTILSWSERSVSARVPRGAVTGTMRVVTAAQVRTNDLPFTIGQCTQTSCSGGTTCCADGLCRKEGSCPETGACRYRWFFSTGATFALPCGADNTCPKGFTCDVSTKQCVPGIKTQVPCTTNAQCPSGTYCQRATGRCLDGTPRLIEEPGCANTVQSPTPYRGRIDACTNARFGARFSVPLDAPTLDGAVELMACGGATDFDVNACTERVQGAIETIPGQDGPQGFLFRPAGTLKAETWYSMLIRKTLRSVAHIPLDEDQRWHTRTGKRSCALDHLEVIPSRAVVIGVGSSQAYRALPTAQNCNVLPRAGPWTWVSKDETRATVTPVNEEGTDAVARAVTPREGVTLEATLEKKRDTGVFVVRLEAPKLTEWWPACAAACRNAELGLRFSVPMRLASFTEKTVRLEACSDASCKAVTRVPLTGFAGEEGGSVVVFRSAKGMLAPGMTYRMVLVASQLLSRDGAALADVASTRRGDLTITNDRYTWTFRTLDTRAACTVDRVTVAPPSAILEAIFATQDFAAVPRGKSDACDRDGQRLIATGYTWSWASSQEQVAAILPDQTPQDPLVLAEARGSGQTAISAETQGTRGIGTLSVVCSAIDDRSCGASHGVGIDRCCYPRPKLLAKKPEGVGACRNGVVQLTFDQPMDPRSVEQGVIVEQEVTGLACGTPEKPIPTSKPGAKKSTQKIFCPIATQIAGSVDGRIFSITPKNVLPKDTTFRVRVVGRESTKEPSVKNHAGVAFDKGVMWDFTTGALICQITNIRIYRDPLTNPIVSDTYHCARQDNCTDDVSATVSGNQHRLRAEAFDQEGRPVGATYTWNSRNRRIADLAVTNGEAEVTAGENGKTELELTATGTSTGSGKGSTVLPIDVTACANPWPAPTTQGTGTLWEPFVDTRGTTPTNFSTWYCRDRGEPGVDDDLPSLTWPPAPEVGFEQDPKKRDLLKGFLMQVVGGGEEDAIGIEVFRNPDQKSLATWYAQQFPVRDGKSTPAPVTIDSYPALRDGRTLYVQALNVVGNDVFTNVYLLAYGLGASEDTIAIVRQLEANLRFTVNITDEEARAKLQRDVARVQALKSMRSALDARGAPKLEAGSFIQGVTFSTWPLSWNRLGSLAGGSFPTDPVNRFEGCSAPFDAATCWNPVRKKNEPITKQFKCPTKAFAYGYKVDPGSPGGYILAANFEYDGPGSLKRDPLYRSLDGLLGSGVCTK